MQHTVSSNVFQKHCEVNRVTDISFLVLHIRCFIFGFIREGSAGLILIILFGIHSCAKLVIVECRFVAYESISLSFKASQSMVVQAFSDLKKSLLIFTDWRL